MAIASPQNSTTVRSNPTPADGGAASRRGRGARGLGALLRVAGGLSPSLAGALAARAFFAAPPRRRATAAEAAVLESGERHVLRHDGERLVYVEWGEGRPVVLLHGWGGSAAQLTPLVRPLLARGFRVQALDAAGHGESSGGWASIPRFASGLAALLATHAGGASVVAHSMGAAATSLAAARGAPVARAALIGPPADARTWFRAFERALDLSPELSAAALRAIEAKAGVPIGELAAAAVGPRVRVPVLVVHDESDREVAFSDGETVARAIPGAALHPTRGHGHRRILAAPEVHAAITDFLAPRRVAAHAAAAAP